MKNILTLTDYSQIAENAVESAFIFSKNFNANLTIYHNTEQGEIAKISLSNPGAIQLDTLKQKTEIAPIDHWTALTKKHKVSADFILGTGDLKDNIEKIVSEQNIDLVIMGSTGAGGKEEYIWGSNTEKIIDKIDCPVLVIKNKVTDYRLDNIVFASSFDSNEKDVFKYAMDLLSLPEDAVIHLLSVDTLSYFTQPTIVVKSAMKDFEAIAKPYTVISHFYKDYSIDAGIRHFLEEIKPDMLIMSNKHNNPVKKFIKGSNTIRAVNHADFPVLTIDYK